MKRIAVALAILLAPIVAHAQVPPQNWTQNFIPSLKDWQAALLYNGKPVSSQLGQKVDVRNGISTAQVLQNPTINLGLWVIGNGDLAFVPKGSPIAGSVGSIFKTITMARPGVQNYGDSVECTSSSVAPAAGGNLCQYEWMELTAASGGGWGGNDVVQMDGGFNFREYSTIGREIDINNLAGDHGEFAVSNSVGLLFNGLKYMNTAATSVQTGNKTGGMTGTGGALPIWYYGHHIGGNAVYEADFDTQSSAIYGWRGRGAHTYGASYADDNTTSAAILLGNGGARMGIIGRDGTTNYAMMYMDSFGVIHFGDTRNGNVTTDSNILPGINNTYSLGSSGQIWDNIFVKFINNVPVTAPGAPTIGSACTVGAQRVDATKLYMCLSDGKWHTMATATD